MLKIRSRCVWSWILFYWFCRETVVALNLISLPRFLHLLTPDLIEEQEHVQYNRLVVDDAFGLFTSNTKIVCQLTLASHIHAPKVEMFSQLYRLVAATEPSPMPECDSFVVVGRERACTESQLQTLLSHPTLSSRSNEKIHPIDHVLHLSTNPTTAKIVILYADVSTPAFIPLHAHLTRLSAENDFTFVLRYKPPRSAHPPLVLSGYGYFVCHGRRLILIASR